MLFVKFFHSCSGHQRYLYTPTKCCNNPFKCPKLLSGPCTRYQNSSLKYVFASHKSNSSNCHPFHHSTPAPADFMLEYPSYAPPPDKAHDLLSILLMLPRALLSALTNFPFFELLELLLLADLEAASIWALVCWCMVRAYEERSTGVS